MAKISPRAKKFTSRGYKDFNLSFKSNPVTGDFSTVKNDEAIKQAVRNIVLTGRGEKLFQPSFGSKVRKLLFENFDPFTVDSLGDEITVALLNNEPRIVVTEVYIDEDQYDLNALNVYLEYQIVGQPIVKTLSFILTKAS
jgi:phage baseplate assembly protein W